MDIEVIRHRYRPDRVKLLLVGESPPANGKFFYLRSPMTTFTSRPFEKRYGVSFSSNAEFLDFFRERGCYLEDLCLEPVDRLDRAEREAKLRSSVDEFANRLRTLQPEVVAIVLRKIDKYVREAVARSGVDARVYTLPFPGNGHQNRFIDELQMIVGRHLE